MTTTPQKRFYRVRDLMNEWSVSKPWIFAQLRAGNLRGRKVKGVLLLDGDSVEELLASGEPWKPSPTE